MGKNVAMALVAVLCIGLLAGCCLSHDWQEATCEKPAICTKCGKTEGSVLDHRWRDATCDEPKTCKRCADTRGDALGHAWEVATCEVPATCSRCGKTQGEARGHSFSGGSCVEAPVCDVCGNEGNLAAHSWQAATRTAPKTCEVCGATEGEPLTALEAFPLGQPRYDHKQIYLTLEDFAELYAEMVTPLGFAVSTHSLYNGDGIMTVTHPELPEAKMHVNISGDAQTGTISKVIATFSYTDDTWKEAFTGPMHMLMRVLVGLEEEAYNSVYEESLKSGTVDQKNGSTGIVSTINGLKWLLMYTDGMMSLQMWPENR